jgi:hypothetical protein
MYEGLAKVLIGKALFEGMDLPGKAREFSDNFLHS